MDSKGELLIFFLSYFFSLKCDSSSQEASLESVEKDNKYDEEAGVKHLNWNVTRF